MVQADSVNETGAKAMERCIRLFNQQRKQRYTKNEYYQKARERILVKLHEKTTQIASKSGNLVRRKAIRIE